jgi:hypothetical protein
MKRNMTKKIVLSMAFSTMLTYVASAQGWVGDRSGSRLYAVNDSLQFGNISVGIGTNTPTAQLHTTGAVRFAGIGQNNSYSRLLVQDTTGRIFWRDVATVGSGSTGSWLLRGNAGTRPDSNFIGTTDAARLVFKTANVERATIQSNGQVGIGLNAPVKLLHVHNSNANTEDNNVYLSGRAPSIYWALNPTQPAAPPFNTPYGRMGLSTRTGTFLQTSQPGDFILHAITEGGSLLFGVGINAAGDNGVERARITSAGNLGINTISPNAKLHVNGDVRFQNLPSGTGRYSLVMDDSGRVYKTIVDTTVVPGDTALAALQQEVADLKAIVAGIQAQMGTMTTGSLDVTTDVTVNRTTSLSSQPNPFNGTTSIRYSYPSKASQAYINVTDVNGNRVKRFDLKKAGGNSLSLTFDGSVNSGTYIYNLEVDGKVVESRKLVYVK